MSLGPLSQLNQGCLVTGTTTVGLHLGIVWIIPNPQTDVIDSRLLQNVEQVILLTIEVVEGYPGLFQ